MNGDREGVERRLAFLAGENEQAWTHYRHVEVQRSQYLGFFFTVSLGATVALPIVSAAGIGSDAGLIAGAAFLATYFVVTIFVWSSIRRSGNVLSHYDRCLRLLRDVQEEFCELPSEYRGILTTKGRSVDGPHRSGLQKSAEWTLAGFGFAEVLAQIALFVVAVAKSTRADVVIALGIVGLVSAAVLGSTLRTLK